MSNEKNFLDKLFDIADQALTPLETALSKDPAPQKQTAPKDYIDVEPNDHDTTKEREKEWESTWKEPHWGVGDDGHWHSFEEAQVTPRCKTEGVLAATYRSVLEHGKFIPACTSCIIAVSK